MKLKVVVHEAEEGGYWAEVPGIPGCASQGETMEELRRNLCEAIEGCLCVDVAPAAREKGRRGKRSVLEIEV
jgi:predicted RNase H-like HicB family nuclease